MDPAVADIATEVEALVSAVCERTDRDAELARHAILRACYRRAVGIEGLFETDPSHDVDLPEGRLVALAGAVAAYGGDLGSLHEALLASGDSRRSSGSYYTPPELVETLLDDALEPLLDAAQGAGRLDGLTICDPACGSGRFLVAAVRRLVRRGLAAEQAARCVHGVDVDPLAVDLTRAALLRETGAAMSDLTDRIRVGHALLGATPITAAPAAFDWPAEFPEVFDNDAGFDLVVGNPPWLAHAGRAAQRLPRTTAAYLTAHNPAFAGYRTTHGAFVRRCAELLAAGGTLALVLPTSVADLDGYLPTRRAHDELCEPLEPLTSYGDGTFDGVFQPTMTLVSRRVATPPRRPPTYEWALARDDLDADAETLLARFLRLPTLPPELFAELGVQTTPATRARLKPAAEASQGDLAILEGKDVTEFAVAEPRLAIPAELIGPRARRFAEVELVVRQTARFPIVGYSGGHAFRNSLLAVVPSDEWPADVLAGVLNSAACRWLHFHRFRDAREGMPQVKVGQLRRTPRGPGFDEEFKRRLTALVVAVDEASHRDEIDRLVSVAYGLTAPQHDLVVTWARTAAPARFASPVASRSSRAPRSSASVAVRAAAPLAVRRSEADWAAASSSSQSATVARANPDHGPSGSTSERA